MNTSLYLFPLPVLDAPPSVSVIETVLQKCGFLGDRMEGQRYLVGSAFFQHISFAGCSPHLQLERPAQGGWSFCHIVLHGDQQPPSLHITPQRGRPRCPACRTLVSGWKEQLASWKKDASRQWHCDSCGTTVAVAELDWRQYGFGARCSVEVQQVYPGEAVPGDRLLQLLKQGSGREWRYAWATSERVL